MKRTILVAVSAATTSCVHAFISCPTSSSRTTHTSLNMGLFNGVKEAFGADGMGDLSSERETPIDRWMGWNAKSVDTPQEAVGSKAPLGFVDSMDKTNYISASLSKPMGIVFEENDIDFGGIFVLEINEGSSAAMDGTLQPGDQLVSVGEMKVSGMQFEEALGAIINSKDAKVKLTFFRGPAKFLYGPAGASQDWLNEFIRGGVKVESA